MSTPITTNGTTVVTTFPGECYVVGISGGFGGGSMAVNWLDGDGDATPYNGSPLTTGETFVIAAVSTRLQLVLTGATAPTLEAVVTLAGPAQGSAQSAVQKRVHGRFVSTGGGAPFVFVKIGSFPVAASEAAVGKYFRIHGSISQVALVDLVNGFLILWFDNNDALRGERYMLNISAANIPKNKIDIDIVGRVKELGVINHMSGPITFFTNATGFDGIFTVTSLGSDGSSSFLNAFNVALATEQNLNVGYYGDGYGDGVGTWTASMIYDLSLDVY